MDKPRKRTAEILSACLTIAVCFSGCSVSRNLVFDAVEEKKEQIELDVFRIQVRKFERHGDRGRPSRIHGQVSRRHDCLRRDKRILLLRRFGKENVHGQRGRYFHGGSRAGAGIERAGKTSAARRYFHAGTIQRFGEESDDDGRKYHLSSHLHLRFRIVLQSFSARKIRAASPDEFCGVSFGMRFFRIAGHRARHCKQRHFLKDRRHFKGNVSRLSGGGPDAAIAAF